MKLIYAIISSDDSSSVSGALTQNGFFATKLASTFLICTDDENVDQVIRIIAEHSKKRKQMVSSSAGYGMGSYTPFPVEVTVGGATIIVTDVQRFEKL